MLPSQVQLQLLTAIVKLFLKKPTETQELVQQVLSLATQVRCPHRSTHFSEKMTLHLYLLTPSRALSGGVVAILKVHIS